MTTSDTLPGGLGFSSSPCGRDLLTDDDVGETVEIVLNNGVSLWGELTVWRESFCVLVDPYGRRKRVLMDYAVAVSIGEAPDDDDGIEIEEEPEDDVA